MPSDVIGGNINTSGEFDVIRKSLNQNVEALYEHVKNDIELNIGVRDKKYRDMVLVSIEMYLLWYDNEYYRKNCDKSRHDEMREKLCNPVINVLSYLMMHKIGWHKDLDDDLKIIVDRAWENSTYFDRMSAEAMRGCNTWHECLLILFKMLFHA